MGNIVCYGIGWCGMVCCAFLKCGLRGALRCGISWCGVVSCGVVCTRMQCDMVWDMVDVVWHGVGMWIC